MTFLLLLAAIVALIWGALYFRQTGFVGGCLAVLFFGSVFGHSFFHLDIGPLPITSDRFLLGMLAVAFLAARRLGHAQRLHLDKSDVLLALLLVVLTISACTRGRQDGDMTGLSRMLFFFAAPAALYVIARGAPYSRQAITGVFAALAAFGGYLAATGVAEKLGMWSLVYPRYIASPEVFDFYGRARGPFLNPLPNGIFMTVGMCSALMLWPRANRVSRLLLLACLPLYLAGIYATMTRCIWIGAVLALAIVLGLAVPRNVRFAMFGVGAALAIVLVASQWENLQGFKRDKFVSVSDMRKSASLRPLLMTVAWKMFLDRPLMGCGLGRYPQECLEYVADRTSEQPLEMTRGYVQHNVFLALLAETGLIGASTLVLLLMFWLRNAWWIWSNQRANREERQVGLLFLALLATYGVNGMFHDVSITAMANSLLFFVAGLARGMPTLADRLGYAETRFSTVATSRPTTWVQQT